MYGARIRDTWVKEVNGYHNRALVVESVEVKRYVRKRNVSMHAIVLIRIN